MQSLDSCPDRLWLAYRLLLSWGVEALAQRAGDAGQLAGEATPPEVVASESAPCPL